MASNDCIRISGWLKTQMQALGTALDGGNREQVISLHSIIHTN